MKPPMPPLSTSPSVQGLPCLRISASQWNLAGSLSAAQTPMSAVAAAWLIASWAAGSSKSQANVRTSRSGRRSFSHSAARSALSRPTADGGNRCRSTLCGLYTSGSIRVTVWMRGSWQSRSRTGIPPLPAPTWIKWATGIPPREGDKEMGLGERTTPSPIIPRPQSRRAGNVSDRRKSKPLSRCGFHRSLTLPARRSNHFASGSGHSPVSCQIS